MPITKLILSYLLTFAVFFVIDMAWLGFIAKDLYRKHLSGFLSDEVNWPAAFIFYLLFIVGVFIFAILPAVEKDSVRKAMILGLSLIHISRFPAAALTSTASFHLDHI